MAGPIKWRNAYLYWDGTFVTEGTAISVSFTREFIDDTAYGDTNRTFQVGFGDFEISVSRHYDQQSAQASIEADALANDPDAKLYYLYPDRGTLTDYWYGNGYVSLDSHGGDMSGLWEETYTIKASDEVTRRVA